MSETDDTGDEQEPTDEQVPDGGTESKQLLEGASDAINGQFERIKQTRKKRAIGWLAILGFLVFITLQGFAATEIFDTDFRFSHFFDRLTEYIPLTSFGVIPFVDVSQYTNFIRGEDLLYDPEIGGLLFTWPPELYTFFFVELGIFRIFGVAGETFAMGLVGTILGFPLAFLFSTLGSERVTPFPFNFIFRGTMSFIRSIPAIIWTLIFIPLFGLGVAAATLAIAFDTIGNLGRLFVDELEEIEEGPIEAMRTTGASKPQIVFFGMLSQVRTSFIAWTLYILEINVRIAVTVGVISGGGLGWFVNSQRNQFAYTNMMATLLCIFLLIITVELFSQRLRSRLRSDEEKMSWRELIFGFPNRMADSMLK